MPENAAQLDPNEVKGGSAPDEPIQLPEFTATDQSGNEFGLEQLKVSQRAGLWISEKTWI